MFISILYMFQAAMCPSSGELYQYDIWYMSLCIDDRLVCRFGWDCSLIQTCTPNPDSVLFTVVLVFHQEKNWLCWKCLINY